MLNDKYLNPLIESIGLTEEELTPFLFDEINEFLNAKKKEDIVEEFHDVIFILKCLAYTKEQKHVVIDESIYISKIRNRLKEYGTISKKLPIHDPGILELEFGVVHVAFGNFKQPWSPASPVKNGTETEVSLLTDNEFQKENIFTNQIILTFDNVDELEYTLLYTGADNTSGSTVLCRLPDFIYQRAKERNDFGAVQEMLSLQVFSALKRLHLLDNCIFHFHSWEAALAKESEETLGLLRGKKKLFSPYLTVNRLKNFHEKNKQYECTLSDRELAIASAYEMELINYCDEVVVESKGDLEFYQNENHSNLKIYSYSLRPKVRIKAHGLVDGRLFFISGGRAVYEKGFKELIGEATRILEYARQLGVDFGIKILCKEYGRSTNKLKKMRFIDELERLIVDLGLSKHVFLCDKVSIDRLKDEIKNSCGLIVPSLYDPYCLMPDYAIEAGRICFVSKHTGISENIESRGYVFDPSEAGSLLGAIKWWLNTNDDFVLNNENVSYKKIYLTSYGNR